MELFCIARDRDALV
jgi:hypothetical protein